MYLEELTNRIIYNRIKRETIRILRYNLFEQNDKVTRNKILTPIKIMLERAKLRAIKDFKLRLYDYDEKTPHLIKIDIALLFKNRIEYVLLNISEMTH